MDVIGHHARSRQDLNLYKGGGSLVSECKPALERLKSKLPSQQIAAPYSAVSTMQYDQSLNPANKQNNHPEITSELVSTHTHFI